MTDDAARLTRLQAWVLRAPHERPVKTSFGTMRDRPALLLRIEDADGAFGWGEVWCNWPACGAEHRLKLIEEDLRDALFAMTPAGPAESTASLTERFAVKAIQTGEQGPYAQILAGLDTALCDRAARRAGMPLHAWLSPGSTPRVAAYASGIHIDDAADIVPASREAGFRAFKTKVGFHRERDVASTIRVKAALRQGESLMADANQAWDVESARRYLQGVAEVGLGWMEEPLRADVPWPAWLPLRALGVPLAGGENILGHERFDEAIAAGVLSVIQPDVAKWGGVTGCLAVAQAARAAGRRYCPHFLGAGVGLLASAHLLAAAGGDGMLEIDVNPNPLRSDLLDDWPRVENGCATLPEGAGLGIEPVSAVIECFATERLDLS